MIRYEVFNLFDCGPVDPESPILLTVYAEDREELKRKVCKVTGLADPHIQVHYAELQEEQSQTQR